MAVPQRLGIVPSFSRPSVKGDNAFSEALFRTLKVKKRKEVHEEAREANPIRWTRGTRNWERVSEVGLNPSNVLKRLAVLFRSGHDWFA